MRPSFIASMFNGLLMLVVLIYTVIYWKELSNYERIVIMSLIALQIGLHGLLHHIEEISYDWNPLEGRWIPKERSQLVSG